MKKLLLLVGLVILAVSAFAQTGLFGISFGDTTENATAKLKALGFVQTSFENSFIKFDGGTNSELPTVELSLNFDETAVAGWFIRYDLAKYPEKAETVIATLKEIHNDDPYEDLFDYDYIWYLTLENALYVDIYEEDHMAIGYTQGNYDDDDFLYYGDEEFWW